MYEISFSGHRVNETLWLRVRAADDAGLRLTSKRCRRMSRDVSRTSGSRGRHMSSPVSLPVTSSGGMLFGRRLDDICQPDLPPALIQVDF